MGRRLFFTGALFMVFCMARVHAQTELLVNGGFESGRTGWTFAGGADVYTDGYARSGAGYAWFGGAEYEVDSGYQTITIPANATSATLSFYYNILSEDDPSDAYDTFSVTINDANGGFLATVGNWSNADQDYGTGPAYYHPSTFNLLPYAGQTIRITFSSDNDSLYVTSFLVDDVSVQVETTATPPPNDTCSGAVAMSAGTTYTLNTAHATSDADPVPSCQPSFGNGVWYSYTPIASGAVTISTCGSSFDTALGIYTGSCGSLTPVACNDNDGPSCSGGQASVSFTATGGVTYLILAGGASGQTGNLNILATGPGGLIILPTFDSSITSDPQAATIEATINAALALYQNSFSDPTIVTITFQEMGGGLGQSSSYYNSFAYSDYRSALVSHATTADDATALNHLPVSSGNPVNGNSSVHLTLPLARTLGFNAATPPGDTDGTIYLNTSIMNLSVATTNPSKFSLFATVCHEVDEVLGFGSALNGLNNGDPAPTGPVSPNDLFRYDGTGARSLTTDVNAAAYFSLDGTTDLVRFNQHQGGDFQDWYSYYGTPTPRVQDAYGTPGTSPTPNVELTMLDVIGYARAVQPRPTLALTRAGNNVVLAWPSSAAGYSLETTLNVGSQAWTAVTNLPVLVNNVYYVTNSAAGTDRFYRLRN